MTLSLSELWIAVPADKTKAINPKIERAQRVLAIKWGFGIESLNAIGFFTDAPKPAIRNIDAKTELIIRYVSSFMAVSVHMPPV